MTVIMLGKVVARIVVAVTANRDVAVAVAVKSLTATLIFMNVEEQCFEMYVTVKKYLLKLFSDLCIQSKKDFT